MTTARVPVPGDPGYISVEMHVQHQLAFNREYEARPDIMAKRAQDMAAVAARETEMNARRKHPKLMQTTDYPWLKPGWVETPVRPFRRK